MPVKDHCFGLNERGAIVRYLIFCRLNTLDVTAVQYQVRMMSGMPMRIAWV